MNSIEQRLYDRSIIEGIGRAVVVVALNDTYFYAVDPVGIVGTM